MRENNGEELLPCPFCGSKATIVRDRDIDGDTWSRIGCTSCSIFYTTMEWASTGIDKWNTRHPDPVKDELVEALKEMVDPAYEEDRDMGENCSACIGKAESALKKAGVQNL